MYQEKRIKIHSFQKRENPNIKGSQCAFNERHFIDYREECYIHPDLKIIICIKCRDESKPRGELKYHNQPNNYNGHYYQSGLEADYARRLDLLLRIGEIKKWEKQVKIELNVKLIGDIPILTNESGIELKKQGIKFYHLCNYFIDFIITHKDDSLEYVETKGYAQEIWKLKWVITQAVFKGNDKIKLTVIKKQSYKPKREIK